MTRTKTFRRFKEFMKKVWAKKVISLRTRDLVNYIITDKEIGILAHTPKQCSCEMCGNPRHHKWSKKDQLTMAERKEEDRFKYRDDTYFEDDKELY